jgi:hypothetical protein
VLFQQPKETLDIRHVAGSSGGSVAATVVTQLRAAVPATALPHHRPQYHQEQQHHVIDEYARAFMHQKGRALTLLKERLTEHVNSQQQHSSQQRQEALQLAPQPVLGICTTKCSDGTAHMFLFSDAYIQDDKQLEILLACVEASCAIPRSFHPWDVFTSQTVQYPVEEGIRINKLGAADDDNNDESYVNGGIAAPAPPTPPELTRIIISPVAGESPVPCHRISPIADPSFSNLRLPFPLKKGDFGVHMSWQNLKALRASAGMVSTEELLLWYEQGQRDAERFVNKVLPTIPGVE